VKNNITILLLRACFPIKRFQYILFLLSDMEVITSGLQLTHKKTACAIPLPLQVSCTYIWCIKLSCDSRFQRAFTPCSCVFKVITLVWANQGNYFENATACSKRTLKTTVATQLKSPLLNRCSEEHKSIFKSYYLLKFFTIFPQNSFETWKKFRDPWKVEKHFFLA